MKNKFSIFTWLRKQFKTKPLQSYLITSVVGIALVVGVLFAFGVIDVLKQMGFSYLPKRDYILGAKEDQRPETLHELLHCESPDIEDFFRNPQIAEELLAAESLVDIVDSRYALNNLRELENQLGERAEEEGLPMGDLLHLSSITPDEKPAEKPADPNDPAAATKPFMPDPAPVEERDPLEKTERAQTLNEIAEEIDISRPAEPAYARGSYNTQQLLILRLNDKVNDLLSEPEYGEWVGLEPTINMKGVWQNPGESLLHMIPEANWVPQAGYRIFRQIGDQRVLIVEQAAATERMLSGDINHEHAEEISEIYKQAEYSEEDRAALGMDESEFSEQVYRTRETEEPMPHLSGETDFKKMREEQITIPDGFEQKMPETDRLLGSPIYLMNLPENGRYEAASIRSKQWENYSVRQTSLPYGVNELKNGSDDNPAYTSAAEILDARQQISTMAFVDDEFAEEAGFLIKDDLSGLGLADGEMITYRIEAPDGQFAEVCLHWGEEVNLTKPEGFMGYGLDGIVSLRWRKPSSEAENSITSGYFIERKLEGEKDFKLITEKPVVITESLDETGIFFETPVMFQDRLENGTRAQYRIYSIDIFGRRSEPCDPIDIHVQKVTPPDAPTTASVMLSEDADTLTGNDVLTEALKEAIQKNGGKQGIVIPIFNESPDTVRFTLYRAEAVGVGAYSAPVPLANFMYDNPKSGQNPKEGTLPGTMSEEMKAFYGLEDPPPPEEKEQSPKKDGKDSNYGSKRLFRALHIILNNNLPTAPDMVYFDSQVKEGVTYKYWVSAWDSWDNESPWSQSAAVGVPTDAEPGIPKALTISMMTRELPDYSALPPGLVQDNNVSYDMAEENDSGPQRLSAENTTLVEKADRSGASIGEFLTARGAPLILSPYFNNLPEQRYIHIFIGVRGKDVLPDGSARLKWPAYSGDDLAGYAVYQSKVETPLLEDVNTLDREELLSLGQWTKLNEKPLVQNQFLVQGLDPAEGGVNLFLICLEPETDEPTENPDTEETEGEKGDSPSLLSPWKFGNISLETLLPYVGDVPINENPEGGFVLIEWDQPSDLQVKYYRIYRSEVPSFKKPVDVSGLEWTMVKDLNFETKYADPVEQSHAHYYYYKVTAVSPWGIESSVGTIQNFRVPSTKPPQTPNMLLPLSGKDGIEVNFSAVPYCCRYEVYRAEIPKIKEHQLKMIDPQVLGYVFGTPTENDEFLSELLQQGTDSAVELSLRPLINSLGSLKTMKFSDPLSVIEEIEKPDSALIQDAYSKIIHKFGPLAVSEYCDLSLPMMELVEWKKIAEIPVDEDTEETADSSIGLKKPLSVIDYDVRYGTHYLYTVQAWNDDELGSTRPEPVEATPRRNRPFDPITGLNFTISSGEFPSIDLTWNEPRMEGLTKKQCLEDTVGYIVYYSTERDGTYVQASPLLFYPYWRDTEADRAATNWYKVRVLDTGGYLSDFSDPILAREDVTIELPKTEIPEQEVMEAPQLMMDPLEYSIVEGSSLNIPFDMTGTEPVELKVTVQLGIEQIETGITISEEPREILIPETLPIGEYEIKLTAENEAGTAELTFWVYVFTGEGDGFPPSLYLRGSEFEFPFGKGGEIAYGISGDEPIIYTRKLDDAAGADATPMLTHDIYGKKLIVSPEIAPGTYRGYLSARNAFGSDTQYFSITIDNDTFGNLVYFSIEPDSVNSFLPSEENLPHDIRYLSMPRMGQPVYESHNQSGDFKNIGTLPEVYSNEEGYFSGYELRNIQLNTPKNIITHYVGYVGSAELLLGDDGNGQVLPVRITNAEFVEENGKTIFSGGILYVNKPYKFEDIGITISSLNIPFGEQGKASGFVQNRDPGKNLIGNLTGFAFTDAPFNTRFSIAVTPSEGKESVLPPVRIDRLTLEKIDWIEIFLNSNVESDKLLYISGKATLKAPLETLNNEGIKMKTALLFVDAEGGLNGALETEPTPDGGQFLQLLVPGGAGLRVDARVVYEKGEPTDAGYIRGKIILPFEKADYIGPGVAGSYAPRHPIVNNMDYMMDPDYDEEKHGHLSGYELLLEFGQTVQKNGLLIVPNDPELQKECAYAEFSVNNWKGEGFLVESANLAPVRIAERSLKIKDQRAQGIVVTPTSVTIDLDRAASFPVKEGTETPKETEMPFWVGMVFKGGNLKLPTAFVQTTDNEPIAFGLAEGEMIYDLNGFNYQNYLYNNEGVPAIFGDRLGGFKDVKVFDCLLDMYANRVNLEINAEVALELFNNNRVKVKLYTNKEDNGNAKAGQFICSVAPTEIKDFVGLGTKLTIDGGFLEPEGMRFNGTVELETPEIQFEDPLTFSTMIVPANKTDTYSENNKDKLHAWATLDKAATVHMQGFSMDIREINFEYLSPKVKENTPTRFSLWGSVLLSEDFALGTETTDCISLDTLKGPKLEEPVVIYEKSFSVLDTSFDDCIDVKGVLVPKLLDNAPGKNGAKNTASTALGQPKFITPLKGKSGDDAKKTIEEAEKKAKQIQKGLIEFETENLELGFLGSLGKLPIDTITRFGYDVDNERCYFAIGMLKKEGKKELDIGVGSMDKFSGLVSGNMVVERDEDKHLIFPSKKDEMKKLITNMEVDRSEEGNFSAALRGTLNIKKIAQVRDLYFGFENGPMVEASGGLYLPLDINVILDPTSDGFRHVGDVAILYSHPERYFSFNMTLNEIDIIAIKLSGSLGFEFSPKLFGVSIGYPETLAGNVSIYRVGLGLAFRLSDDGANIIKAKVEFGFERSIEVAIVYLKGYIYAGADGGYYADHEEYGERFYLTLYLKGGLEGGIKVGGKRFNIISFYLDARGSLESVSKPKKEWKLSCSAEVSYSLNLFLFSVSGSVTAKFDTTF